MKSNGSYDLVIVGAGIIGISAGIAAIELHPSLRVLIVEKSDAIAKHASGRNSGVLHAGFYYSPESLKAQFCKEGNAELKQFAKKNEITLNECGKVIVAKDEIEASRMKSLFDRGIVNGVDIEFLPASRLTEFEPTARTNSNFIWSPTTAVLNPVEVLDKLLIHYLSIGGRIEFRQQIDLVKSGDEVRLIVAGVSINAKKIINAAGAQSDLLAKKVGVGLNYSVIPFKGNYRKSHQKASSKRLIYPVPHPINPFLGVHTTLTVDGFLKIGPTAMPALGRENYSGFDKIKLSELLGIAQAMKSVARGSKHDLFEIMKIEFPLLFEKYIKKSASQISSEIPNHPRWEKTRSGIRSQLVDTRSGELVQDFKVEEYSNSLHFLNVVSPGWTSALPFTRHFVNDFL